MPHTDTGWSKNTVLTYLNRMEAKGLVIIDKDAAPHIYRAAHDKSSCQAQERRSFLRRVYQGVAGDLVAAFLKEEPISREERERLRKLLDEMDFRIFETEENRLSYDTTPKPHASFTVQTHTALSVLYTGVPADKDAIFHAGASCAPLLPDGTSTSAHSPFTGRLSAGGYSANYYYPVPAPHRLYRLHLPDAYRICPAQIIPGQRVGCILTCGSPENPVP